jgi:exodeoxyribonuclease VII large subunit
VLWKSAAGRLPRDIGDGSEVEVRGHIGVFEKQGNFQIYVSSLRPRGLGPLEVAFRKLKEKLEKEGLFAADHKRPLPRFPRRVGVVTSPTGAAIRDVIHVMTRRWPAIEIVIAPARVQGDGAAAEIVRGIRNLNRLGGVDVMIIGRGGGSLEDLWPFNEETVARAVYASAVPVVSAVGHETDFSISDFVADLRAPTPSAAAEMVVPDRQDVLAAVTTAGSRLTRNVRYQLGRLKDQLSLFEMNRYFRFPQELVLARIAAVDDLAQRLLTSARDVDARRRLGLERLAARLAEHAPRAAHQAAVAAVRMMTHRLGEAQKTLLTHRWTATVDRLAGRLGDLNPDRVLARGYSRTTLERTGHILMRAADAAPGDLLRTHLAQGTLVSRVETAGAKQAPGTAGGSAGEGLSESGGQGGRPPRRKAGPPTDDKQGHLFE